ncbi:MAG TPA: ABC transporter permease [Candidatus Dormibacteraeota bacterium]|nr:ABC transporter permease [Candidatus Dormibacteraeota bacterium]
MAAASVAGLVTGVLAARRPRLEAAALAVAGVILTIPSFALFGMLTILLGIGNPAVELGLALYALLPIIRNTRTGLGAVDPAVVEAARGMGMSPAQVLLRVELPLALPVIVAGLRQATVMVVAIATVGATVGANDLGQPLLEGIRGNDRDAIFAGALLVGVLGVSADALLAALERGLSRGRAA